MKTIVAGSRSFSESPKILVYAWVQEILYKNKITEIVSGTARGIDRYGEEWAIEAGISIRRFKPDWDKQGKKAGYLRNAQMGEYADQLIAFYDGESKGTQHMIDLMNKLNKPVQVFTKKFEIK